MDVLKNTEYGIEAHVSELKNGHFSVALFDTDAELYLTSVSIYPTKAAALAQAERMVA